MQPPVVRQKFRRLAGSVLPGIFMVGYVVGTGSVTAMAAAGAAYGMSLLWTLVAASALAHVMFSAVAKMTMVSGNTMLFNFRRHFGASVTLVVAAAMAVTQVSSIIGVMGILTEVLEEWTRPFTGGAGIGRIPSGLALTALLLALFWQGRHRFFLKLLTVLVAMMGLSFLATAMMARPAPGEVLSGLAPGIPEGGNPHLLLASMVGTTLASVCLFSRSVVIQEEGWRPGELPLAYRDSLISAILLLLINTAIMASAAGTLHREGLAVSRAIDMVKTLEPLAGRFAASLFVVGILAAGLSSLFPNYLLGAWMISDFARRPRELTRAGYRLLVVLTACSGLVVPVFGGSPVRIMIASQAVSPLIMPVMVALTWRLLRRPEFVGRYRNGPWMELGLGATLLVTLYIAGIAITGFAGALLE